MCACMHAQKACMHVCMCVCILCEGMHEYVHGGMHEGVCVCNTLRIFIQTRYTHLYVYAHCKVCVQVGASLHACVQHPCVRAFVCA